VPDLLIGCIGCIGCIEFESPQNDEKRAQFFGIDEEIAH
jgi:hypothetical protein